MLDNLCQDGNPSKEAMGKDVKVKAKFKWRPRIVGHQDYRIFGRGKFQVGVQMAQVRV